MSKGWESLGANLDTGFYIYISVVINAYLEFPRQMRVGNWGGIMRDKIRKREVS